VAARTCVVCRGPVVGRERLVLVRGKRQELHCSETCLRANVRGHLAARMAARLRWTLGASAAVLVVLGVGWTWRRLRAPHPRSISEAWPEIPDREPPPAPLEVGPPWPPTDEQWTALFDHAAWTHPLPGPKRRAARRAPRVFGGAPTPHERPALCRQVGHCGVDLGGELWGEHVYAALDGVVEHVQHEGNDRGGGLYVRIAHFGGGVYTQYFHLAGTPRTLVRGARVRAGEVIGLVGDTGLDETGELRHLTFTLSVRPASYLPEVYWDPTAWLDRAALRVPPSGTVAGFTPPPTLQAARTR
jgi:hypothetical protein